MTSSNETEGTLETMDVGAQEVGTNMAVGGDNVQENVETSFKRTNTVLQAAHLGDLDLPKVTLETATPVPEASRDVELKVDLDDDSSDDEDEDEEFEAEDGEEEEEEMGGVAVGDGEPEEEEVNTEMTSQEKRDMYEAVRCGDIDWLEDCLDKPNSDINMTWYKENLLMIAIRSDQEEMAEFLLDNGVDHTYMTSVVNLKDTPKGKIFERYDVTCRQMAYDRDMLGVVEIIDALMGNLFPFIRPSPRNPRFRRPKPPTPSESGGSSSDDDADVSSVGAEEEGGSEEGGGGEAATRRKQRRKRKKRDVIADAGSSESASEVRSKIDHATQSKQANGSTVKENHVIPEPEAITKAPSLKDAVQSVLVKNDPNTERRESHSVTFVDDTAQPRGRRSVKPGVGSPGTKSSMIVSRAVNQDRRLSAFESGIEEKPLKWRKISTVGSYSRESRSWHVEHAPGQEHVEIIDLRPSSASSTSSSLLSSFSSSLPRSVHRGSLASSIGDNTSGHLSSGETLPPKIKPEKPVPSYMRTTASSLTKKRLKPSFVSSYGALDFR